MNGWIVVIRCTMDEVPVGLYATKREAMAVAVNIDTEDAATAIARRHSDCDPTSPVNVSLLPFRNGVPRGYTVVHDFT